MQCSACSKFISEKWVHKHFVLFHKLPKAHVKAMLFFAQKEPQAADRAEQVTKKVDMWTLFQQAVEAKKAASDAASAVASDVASASSLEEVAAEATAEVAEADVEAAAGAGGAKHLKLVCLPARGEAARVPIAALLVKPEPKAAAAAAAAPAASSVEAKVEGKVEGKSKVRLSKGKAAKARRAANQNNAAA